MSKKNENKLVPKLRFPEFTNCKDWEAKEFSEYIVLYRGSSPRPIQNYLTKDVSGVNWIKIGDTQNAINYVIRNVEEKITVEGSTKSRKVEIGEIVLANSMSFGKTYLLEIAGYIYDGWFVLREYEKHFNKHFLLQLLNSEHLQKQYKRLSAGGIVQNISSEIVYKTILSHTSLSEQQKIASCLSSLDEVITAESQQLELLKDHKKGLLQNLFPTDSITNDQLRITDNTRNSITNDQLRITDNTRNSITNDQLRITDNTKTRNSKFVIRNSAVPKFRFKEFENSGEWVVKKLGEVVEKVGSGVTPLGGEANYKQTGRPLVRSQNVSWGTFLLDNIAFIDEETHQNQISTEIKNDDVLLNITGASIGRSAVANEYVVGGNVNQHVCIIRVKIERLHPYYLNQFLISDFGQKQIDSFQAGGNRQGLNFAQIRSFSIPIPTIKEQQKIASCLSSIDDLIIAQSQKIEALQLHKKGLLQGLFPSITNYESENYDNNVIRNSKFLIEK
ncbi:MAG TPA: restriction endonuclease subunit S [Saprospiraceae bacterium]|nr:restriction endonuclease subunit S [Saprospiraceae bacterium]